MIAVDTAILIAIASVVTFAIVSVVIVKMLITDKRHDCSIKISKNGLEIVFNQHK